MLVFQATPLEQAIVIDISKELVPFSLALHDKLVLVLPPYLFMEAIKRRMRLRLSPALNEPFAVGWPQQVEFPIAEAVVVEIERNDDFSRNRFENVVSRRL